MGLRLQTLSNLLKTFKHSLATYTSHPASSSSSPPFDEFLIKAPQFNLHLDRLTSNTYVLVVLPPGEVEMGGVRMNVVTARDLLAPVDDRGRIDRQQRQPRQLEGEDNGIDEEDPYGR